MSTDKLRVLIVAEHASIKFGGEAALPLHYFRVLRKRDIEAWLVIHARTRDELKSFIQGLADAMIKVAQHPNLCQVMGKTSCQRVLNNFDWEAKVDIVLEIYQESIKWHATE